MRWLAKLFSDEAGFILSSELVLVGTLGVIGATVGLNAISTAVNEELEDVAFAIRSLDQSYEVRGIEGCGAWTAGSAFHQEPVKESLRELDEQIDRDEAAAQKRIEEQEREEREALRAREHRNPEFRQPEMKRPEPQKTQPKSQPRKKNKNRNKGEEEVLL
ncbi:MAG: hypothetical protein ACK5Q5_20185 [Planctomycetaceae bacterium]